ncbi:MAG: nuclear transport factor 2 family protein [Ferruginibacter sp.]
MKKYSLLLIAISISALLNAQKPLKKSQDAIQQTVVKMFDALSNRDSISLKNYCSADITLYEYGQVWNIDTLILKAITLNQAADFKRTNTFDFLNTITDKTIAWVTYYLESTITREGKHVNIQWLETVVLVKERNQWKVKHLHSTLIKRS